MNRARLNEAETRAELIDPALKAAGVEAKKRDLPVTEGLAQAKRYAERLQARFAFATNGEGIYRVDMHTGEEGDLDDWPSPEKLWNATFERPQPWRERFGAVPFEDKGRFLAAALLPAQRHQPRPGGHRRGPRPHPADAGHRHRQDRHRLPDRLEAVPRPLERWPRARPASPGAGRASCFWPTATSSPIRPSTTSRPFPRMPWCASTPAVIRKKGGCRRTAACSSPSSRPS